MSDRFTLHPKCLLTELDDGTGVVLHLDTKLYYTLNETSVFVWKTLHESPRGTEALVTRITESFEVDSEQARADLIAVLKTLIDEGLVMSHPGA